MGAYQSTSYYRKKEINLIFQNLLDTLSNFIFQTGTPDYNFWEINIRKTSDAYAFIRLCNRREIKNIINIISSDFIPYLEKILNDAQYFKYLCREYNSFRKLAIKQLKSLKKELNLLDEDIYYEELYKILRRN